MKKTKSIILAMLFVVCAALAFGGCESSKPDQMSYNREEGSQTEQPVLTEEPTEIVTEEATEVPTEEPAPEPTEIPSAGDEAKALAEAALGRLCNETEAFLPTIGIQYFNQYPMRKDIAPELKQLEEMDDGALAFVEIYESYIDYFENAELAQLYSSYHNKAYDPDFEVAEGFDEWREMELNRRNTEILLSMQPFFEQMDDDLRERFYKAMITVFDLRFDAQTEAYGAGNETKHSDFDISRREMCGLDWEYVYERPSPDGE